MVVGLGDGDVALVGPCAGFDECFDLGAQDEQEFPVRGSLDVLAAVQFREVRFAPQSPIARVVAWQRRGGEQVVCVEHVVEVVPFGPCDQAVA